MAASLDKDIATLLEFIPPMPRPRDTDVWALKTAMNAATAAIPPYEVPLADTADITIVQADVSLELRLYRPQAREVLPIIVYYHGGGYVIGDLNVGDTACRALAADTGALVVSVDYRLAPEFPYPVPNDDAWTALNWVAANAAAFGADASRLAVCGESAGANLSAAITLRARKAGEPAIVAQVLLYPAPGYPEIDSPSHRDYGDSPLLTSDDTLFYWELYLPDKSQINEDAAPALAINHSALPPAFIGLGECDCSRDCGAAYAAQLKEAGVAVTDKTYPGMPHGFYSFIALPRPHGPRWMRFAHGCAPSFLPEP